MAHLGGTFDATQVDPSRDVEPIPSGEYLVHIIDSDMKPTKNGTGQYLELAYEVAEGPYKGRKLWARLNLVNQNSKAVEIAQRDLSAICHATGQMQVTDSQQLHYKPHVVRVEYIKADGVKSQRDSNEIKAYKRAEGYAAPAQAPAFNQPPGQAFQAPQPAASAPPWATQNKAA